MNEFKRGDRAKRLHEGEGAERRDLGSERQKQCERALDLLLESNGITDISLVDLEREIGPFASATLSMMRTVNRLRREPDYKKKIRWVIEGEFPSVRKNSTNFHMDIEDRAGLSVVIVDDNFQKEMEKDRLGMHGMVVRRDSSNPWSDLTVFVNGSYPRSHEVLRHETMHLLYKRVFDRYVDIDMSRPEYLWGAVRDEMLAYLMGGDRIELNISRLLPIGVKIENVLDTWNISDADAWAKLWNQFVLSYKSKKQSPEMLSALKSILLSAPSFDSFFTEVLRDVQR